MNASPFLLKALAVTAELTNTQLSGEAARVMADDLARYPEMQVLGALQKCRRELKGRLTVADVVTRLDDGRPGPEEAWAMLPFDEAQTVVWTDEISKAWGIALPLIEEGERVPARMAFLESYRKAVQEARDNGEAPRWAVSLGHDPNARQVAIEQAVRLGRISHSHALEIGYQPSEAQTLPIAANLAKRMKVGE